jgi:hypothetical protein
MKVKFNNFYFLKETNFILFKNAVLSLIINYSTGFYIIYK